MRRALRLLSCRSTRTRCGWRDGTSCVLGSWCVCRSGVSQSLTRITPPQALVARSCGTRSRSCEHSPRDGRSTRVAAVAVLRQNRRVCTQVLARLARVRPGPGWHSANETAALTKNRAQNRDKSSREDSFQGPAFPPMGEPSRRREVGGRTRRRGGRVAGRRRGRCRLAGRVSPSYLHED